MDSYARFGAVYDRILEPVNGPMRAVAHRVCPPEPGSVVLDVGCGTGAALAEYRKVGCSIIGLDTSPAMLARARKRLGPEADLRTVTDERLPADSDCADLIIVSLVLHSVARSQATALLRETQRVLAPRGRVLVTDFGTAGLRFPRGHMIRGMVALAEVVAGPRHAVSSLAYLRAGGLPMLVEGSGLAVTAACHISGGNVTISVLEPAV